MAERTELMVSVETADDNVYVVTAEVTQTYDTSKGLCVEDLKADDNRELDFKRCSSQGKRSQKVLMSVNNVVFSTAS